jgi:hypothetical protein
MEQKNNTPLIIGIIVVVIILIAGGALLVKSNPSVSAMLGFHAPVASSTAPIGMRYGNASTTSQGRYGGMRGGFATGSIETLNNNGFTLSLSDGSTKDVTLTATSTIQNYASASSTPTKITSDQLSVGEQVSVIGTPNTDGSIDARMARTGTLPAAGSRGNGAGYGGGAHNTPPQPE